MTDDQLNALNAFEEAAGEPDDGVAAIFRIVGNRQRARFFSDGTVPGTVLRFDQFSWCYFTMLNLITGTGATAHTIHKYTRVCASPADAAARAEMILGKILPSAAFDRCARIGGQVMAGTYQGADYGQLTDEAVLYLNPAIVSVLPDWATPANFLCHIGKHHFYRS